jgi:hypothetical protein
MTGRGSSRAFRLAAGWAAALALAAPAIVAAVEARAGRAEPPKLRGRPRIVYPSFECPEAEGRLPEAAAAAIAGFLGPDATALCYGDLNGNGKDEVLAAVIARTYGKGLGFYWVTTRSGIFEAGRERRDPWVPLLLTSDRLETPSGLFGWESPVSAEGIGLRVTMTDGPRVCVQLRRLDAARYRKENPLVIVRWDPTLLRYASGACAGGTAGAPRLETPPR